MIAAIAGFTPNGLIISGTNTPVAITGNAANELPITIVNSAIPKQFGSTSKNKLLPGMTD